ncbi:hypothetical protein EV207_10739 [Scopulibacillus darangshiensis]|uniref:Uncharacterized protein n=1 Tax=Scopulibacillus darangshiensis TaxID=442528 RepID=A0A4R2P7Z3_9BACL|nr:hypothetical protein [Scopulibacillus darangshiensis]TCP29945.1 hypothetical protein EV207_10739 [Scopulibacillus darangshiensis]
MKKKLLPIFLVSCLSLILLGIKVYPKLSTTLENTFNDKDTSTEVQGKQGNDPTKNNIQHRNKLLSVTFPFETKEREKFAKEHADQFNIVKKMYYSWDYIRNVQGEFEWGDPGGETFYNKFYVDFIKKKNHAKNERLKKGKVIETQNLLFKDNVAILQMPKKGIFTKKSIEEYKGGSAEAFEADYLGAFNRMVTNSEWFTLIYDDYKNWTYKEGEKFGIPVYEIKGEIPKNKSNSLTGPFTMVVSKRTGVLLDLKCYGDGNNIKFFVTARNIEINKGIKNDVFNLDVSGNKEVSNLNSVGDHAVENKSGGVKTD